MVFRKTPAESNPDCHQQVCLFDATGQNTRSLQGLTAGLSTSICLQNVAVVFPRLFTGGVSRLVPLPLGTRTISEGGEGKYARGGSLR